jgi:signal peptidase
MKKLIVRILSVVLLVLIGLLAFIYFSPDYGMYFVRSGSMVPKINIGDLVITGPAGGLLTPEIEPGTIITYTHSLGDEVTHRVISVTDARTFITKGDNAEDPDQEPVSLSQVRGVYILKVPYLGYITSFMRTKLGWFLAILVPAAVLVILLVKDIVKEALRNET